MRGHASTRERLPILSEFYQIALAPWAPVQSIVDIACGLGPLAIPWMPLAPNARYVAVDMYTDLVAFLEQALPILGVKGTAIAMDITQSLPIEPVEVALLLKTLPCIERMDAGASLKLLEQVPARHLVVSFPIHSLGGRDRAMRQNYARQFCDLLARQPWRVEQLDLFGELVFRVSK